jgi:hypothetical protein
MKLADKMYFVPHGRLYLSVLDEHPAGSEQR